MVVSVQDDRQLQAAVLAFKVADRALRKDVNDATRATFNAPWRAAVAARARTTLEQRVLVPGARVAAGNPPAFVAASSRRKLSGGLIPDTSGGAVEWGAKDTITRYQRRTPSGRTANVERHTRRQLPRRRRAGPVSHALGEMGSRVASLWVQMIVRAYYRAADGKGG